MAQLTTISGEQQKNNGNYTLITICLHADKRMLNLGYSWVIQPSIPIE